MQILICFLNYLAETVAEVVVILVLVLFARFLSFLSASYIFSSFVLPDYLRPSFWLLLFASLSNSLPQIGLQLYASATLKNTGEWLYTHFKGCNRFYYFYIALFLMVLLTVEILSQP